MRGLRQRRGDKLAGAVRLVARREAARQHHDLRAIDAFGQRLDGFFDALSGQVAEDEYIRFRARAAERLFAVQFAVRTGEGPE